MKTKNLSASVPESRHAILRKSFKYRVKISFNLRWLIENNNVLSGDWGGNYLSDINRRRYLLYARYYDYDEEAVKSLCESRQLINL